MLEFNKLAIVESLLHDYDVALSLAEFGVSQSALLDLDESVILKIAEKAIGSNFVNSNDQSEEYIRAMIAEHIPSIVDVIFEMGLDVEDNDNIYELIDATDTGSLYLGDGVWAHKDGTLDFDR